MKFKEFVKRHKEKLILSCGALGIGVISLAITLTVYNVELSRYNAEEIDIEKEEPEVKSDIVFNQDLTEAQKIVAENLIAKLDELEKNKTNEKNSNNNGTINKETNNVVKINNSNENNNILTTDKIENNESVVEVFANKNDDESFIKPVDGDIGMEYSSEHLVYSKTLKEWINHNGIDFLAKEGENVKAVANGIVKDFYKDNRYGYTIVIEHSNGYISKYSCLQQNIDISIGDKVNQGDIISKIGEAFGFEREEGCHLHFEILKDGENICPSFT